VSKKPLHLATGRTREALPSLAVIDAAYRSVEERRAVGDSVVRRQETEMALKVLANYYQNFDADFSLDVPAEVEISEAHTAVAVMHAWDCGGFAINWCIKKRISNHQDTKTPRELLQGIDPWT